MRDTDTDIMRVVSSFFVVLLHTASYSDGIGAVGARCARLLDALSRFSVPVFVMISGRYMLEKERAPLRMIIKSVKIIIIMLMTSSIYAFNEYLNGIKFGAAEFVKYIFTQPVHLWYIYTAACLYLFTPVFEPFIRISSKKRIAYAAALCLFFGSVLYIPLNSGGFGTVKQIIEKCKMGGLPGFTGCFLLGYYLSHFDMTINEKRIIYFFGAAGLAVSLAAALMTDGLAAELMTSFFAPNVICISSAVFCVMHSSRGQFKNSPWQMSFAADCSFGIYLWHPLVLFELIKYAPRQMNAAEIVFFAAVIWLLTFAATAFYRVLRKQK